MSRLWTALFIATIAAFPLTFSGCGDAHMSQNRADTEEEIPADDETEADYSDAGEGVLQDEDE